MVEKIKLKCCVCVVKLKGMNIINFINFIFCSLCFMMILLLFFFAWQFFDYSSSSHYTSYLAILAALVALATLAYNARRHLSEDYCEEAKEYLKRAFEILDAKEDGLPPNDRLSWITAARFIKVSERLSKKLIMTSHKETYIEEAEYWRGRFRGIIKDFPADYYAESPEKFKTWTPEDREPIAESSIYVIYKFMEWDSNYTDPLPDVRFSDNDIAKMCFHQSSNLGRFLQATRKR